MGGGFWYGIQPKRAIKATKAHESGNVGELFLVVFVFFSLNVQGGIIPFCMFRGELCARAGVKELRQ